MRYYRIEIISPGAAVDDPPFAVYTSFVNGANDAGALQVELDIPTASYALALGAAFVRIWGVDLRVISQASDLNGKSIRVFGGMQKGLPLANPSQSGLLVEGKIIQAFGNWIDTNMSLDLMITVPDGSPETPSNVVFDWKAGTPFDQAVANTLTTAFPDNSVSVDVSSKIVTNSDVAGFYQSVTQFSQYVKEMTKATVGGEDYQGADIILKENTFYVFDGSSPQEPKEIDFNDLIGQPTWIDSPVIQITTVMRADLRIGGFIRLPKTPTTTTPQSLSQYRAASVFTGVFQIQSQRHVGDFRNPSAAAWVTVLNAYPYLQPEAEAT